MHGGTPDLDAARPAVPAVVLVQGGGYAGQVFMQVKLGLELIWVART